MSQGINREVAREALSLEPSQLLEFYLIYYAWPLDPNSFLALTPMQKGMNTTVKWQGIDYISYPMEVKGFSSKGDGQLARPRVTISNRDLSISKYLKVYDNLIGTKVVRKRTFAKFLDDANFPGGENPYYNIESESSAADQTAYLPDQVYYISRRSVENKEVVELELASVLETSNVYIPNRNTYSRYCTWTYRGHGCRYALEPKTTANSEVFTHVDGFVVEPEVARGAWNENEAYEYRDYVFIETPNMPLRADGETDLHAPAEKLKTFYVCVDLDASGKADFPPLSPKWQRDECGKQISDCKLRFGENLRFGGFPGTHEYQPK